MLLLISAAAGPLPRLVSFLMTGTAINSVESFVLTCLDPGKRGEVRRSLTLLNLSDLSAVASHLRSY